MEREERDTDGKISKTGLSAIKTRGETEQHKTRVVNKLGY